MSHFAVEPDAGRLDWVGGLGLHHKVSGDQTDGLFSIVEHPMNPRALAAPLHRHSREDECSYVLEGRVGAQLGDDILIAEAGSSHQSQMCKTANLDDQRQQS